MRRKIEFMNRLFETAKCKFDLLSYLKNEKLISDDKMQRMLNEHHTQHVSLIISLLNELSSEDKLQLVSYEWTILPNEMLKLSLVSQNSNKEFVYSV